MEEEGSVAQSGGQGEGRGDVPRPSDGSGSFKIGDDRHEDMLPHPGTQVQVLNRSVTEEDLPSFEHSSLEIFKLDASVYQEHISRLHEHTHNQQTPGVHDHIHAAEIGVTDMSSACTSLPPALDLAGEPPIVFPTTLPFVQEQCTSDNHTQPELIGRAAGTTLSRSRGGRGQGKRGTGGGKSGQSQEVAFSSSVGQHDALTFSELTAESRKGLSKKGNGGSNKRSSQQGAPLLNHEIRPSMLPTASVHTISNSSVCVTGGGLPFFEHGLLKMDKMHDYTHAQEMQVFEMSMLCTALSAPPCTGGLVPGVSGVYPAMSPYIRKQSSLGDHVESELGNPFIRAVEGTSSDLASRGETISRVRGGRGRGQVQGRGRGRRKGENQPGYTTISTPDGLFVTGEASNRGGGLSKRGKSASILGEHKTSFQTDTPPGRAIKVPLIPAASRVTEAFNSSLCAMSDTYMPHVVCSSLPAPPCMRELVTGGFRISPAASHQSRQGDHVEEPSPVPSSPKGGNLREELAEFLMSNPIRADERPCEGARKRTKSRKLVENESLLQELTVGSPPQKAAGMSKPQKIVKDGVPTSEAPIWELGLQINGAVTAFKDVGKALEHNEGLLTDQGELQHNATTGNVCAGGSNVVPKEPQSLQMSAKETVVVACSSMQRKDFLSEESALNSKAFGKKRMQRLIKEQGRFSKPLCQAVTRLPSQDHGDGTRLSEGDVRRLSLQAESGMSVAQSGTHCEFLSACKGDLSSMEGFTRAYGNIEIIEDWHSYCPYAPSSPTLSYVYEEGRPQTSSLPLFGSSHASDCVDKRLPDYYDLVLNAGGSVWALDWCPQRQYAEGCKREFLAIGAHPHDSPSHRLGEAVHGKCLIQIWAFDLPFLSEAQANGCDYQFSRHGGRKRNLRSVVQTFNKRKKLNDDLGDLIVQADVEIEGACNVGNVQPMFSEETGHDVGVCINSEPAKVESYVPVPVKVEGSVPVLAAPPSITEDFDVPQMVLGLAHEGGLVWDAKWQPVSLNIDSKDPCRLGYLAAIFGNGSMQVYDIPLPSLVKKSVGCSSSHSKLTPLIAKLNPVFKCSGLSVSGQMSLPLTLEWSSPPYDHLLVGCHDGVVALWRFSPKASCDHDTRPLSCFVADTAPIRALAFAPKGNDTESSSIIVTGGHNGHLLFWDLRDPFCPLWELALSKGGCILCIDWPSYPKGIVLSMDDGSIRTLGLDVALCGIPLTGKVSAKSMTHGMHTIFPSDHAIWSVQVSRASGLVAYVREDGSAAQFCLTEKFLVSDRTRTKEPHFMCSKLIEDPDSGVISILSLNSDAPMMLKNQRGDNKQTPLAKAFSRMASSNMNEDDDLKIKSGRQSSRSNHRLSIGEETEDEGVSSDEVNPLALVPFDPNFSAKTAETVGKGGKPRKQRKLPAGRSANVRNAPLGNLGGDAHTLPDADTQPAGEKLPSKSVAVHRIRWNENKECESLVCFGGAAGIVRCQLILPRA